MSFLAYLKETWLKSPWIRSYSLIFWASSLGTDPRKSWTTKNQSKRGDKVKSARTNLPSRNKKTKNTSRAIKAQNAPIARGSVQKTGSANIQRHKDGSITVKHREYVADIIGNPSATFPSPSSDPYFNARISPSNSTLFPWLSNISPNYETYIFDRLHVIYEPTCSTTTDGVVMIAIDYDVADALPTSKVQMQSYQDSVRGNSWMIVNHVSSYKNLHKYPCYFTDFSIGSSSSADGRAVLRQNDVGMLSVVSIGNGGNTIGELYVDYQITLKTPQMSDAANGRAISLLEVGSSSPFYTVGDYPKFGGSVNIQLINATSFQFLQYFEGLVFVKQSGSGTALPPGIAVSGGTGTVALVTESVDPSGANGWCQYKCTAEFGCVIDIATGVAGSVTGWRMALVQAPLSYLTFWA